VSVYDPVLLAQRRAFQAVRAERIHREQERRKHRVRVR